MLTFTQAALLGLLQGVTELFPISSLGHTVVIPSLLKWDIDQSNPHFVAFVVLTHLATALVLLAFFWRDWLNIVRGVLRSFVIREIRNEDTYAKLGWLIVVSTIPVGVLGILFQEPLTKLFAAPQLVAGVLILNGVVLYVAERLRRRAREGVKSDVALAKLSWKQSILIGIAQCFALIPGFSRTGLTMTGGLLNGLSHENAARYSFLLATPVILAAAVLKVPDVFAGGAGGSEVGQSFLGALCAGVAAYVSIRFLTKYFETKTLTPFAIYCMIAGIISLVILS
jgi:undecaprenyl-diphosphatase